MNVIPPIPSAVPTAQGSAPSPKLAKAAQEFEAILLSSWLEKLQASFAGPDDGSDPAHDTLSSMGTQAIASALSARGGIGLAKLLLKHFSQASTIAEGAAASTKKEVGITKVPPGIADRYW